MGLEAPLLGAAAAFLMSVDFPHASGRFCRLTPPIDAQQAARPPEPVPLVRVRSGAMRPVP